MWRSSLALIVTVLVSQTHAQQEQGQVDVLKLPVRVRLRVEWSNPTNKVWDGRLGVSQGKLLGVRPLRIHTADCTFLATDSDRETVFRARGGVAWCGIECDVEALPDAYVDLELDGQRRQVKLGALLQGASASMRWDGVAVLRRDPSDILPITFDHPHLIFTPRQKVFFHLGFRFLSGGPDAVPTQVSLELRRARGGEVLVSRSWTWAIPPNSKPQFQRRLGIHMPKNHGVYDLTITAAPTAGRTVSRRVQFVVFDSLRDESSPESEIVEPETIQEIDPSMRHWSQRILPRTSRIGQAIWKSFRSTPETSAQESFFGSYPIRVPDPGQPHMLEIEFNEQSPTDLVTTLSQGDARGQWVMPAASFGMRAGSQGGRVRQLLFWPQNKEPLLSLYADRRSLTETVKEIRVQRLPELSANDDTVVGAAGQRVLGLYLRDRSFWATFGASRSVDENAPVAFSDWTGFYDAADRITQYATYMGYNHVVIPAVLGSEALFPSRLLPTAYEMDSGYLATGAPDPVRKDLVELLIQMCERRGLDVLLSVRVEGKLPQVESKLRETADPARSGMLLVSKSGKLWRRDGHFNRYNPTHPEVQAAIVDLVREIAERYRRHSCVQGMVLDLSSDSHLVFPGADWGCDPATLRRFTAELDKSIDPSKLKSLLDGRMRSDWLAWRHRQLSKLCDRIHATFRNQRSDLKTVVALTQMSGSGGFRFRNALRKGGSVREFLRETGVDVERWRPPTGMSLVRPVIVNGTAPEERHLNSNGSFRDLPAISGSVCLGRVDMTSSPVGDVDQPIFPVAFHPGDEVEASMLSSSFAECDSRVILHSIPAQVPNHSQLLPRFALAYRSLPDEQFTSAQPSGQVIVRWRFDGIDTHLYAVNTSEQPTSVRLQLNAASMFLVVDEISGDEVAIDQTESGGVLVLELGASELRHFRVLGNDVSVDVSGAESTESTLGLMTRFEQLNGAMESLRGDTLQRLENLPANGGFETLSNASPQLPADWEITGSPSSFRVDSEQKHSGTNSFRITGTAGDGVGCQAFDHPRKGALTLNVWMTAGKPGLQVRWVLIGTKDEIDVYRSQAIVTLADSWRAFEFQVSDVPDVDQLRFRFELLEEGTLWIDQVQLSASSLSRKERRTLIKLWSAAFKAWKDRRMNDFQRLANGYWAWYAIDRVRKSEEEVEPEEAEKAPM